MNLTLKIIDKFFVYLLYILGFIWWGNASINLIFGGSVLISFLGIASMGLLISALIILSIREILYWTKNDNDDKH